MRKELSRKYRALLRLFMNIKNRKRLINREFSIISSNCTGGVICHELGVRFDSPFVNVHINAPDFIKILKNLHYYVNCNMMEVKNSGEKYPVGRLDDVTIYGDHYADFDELKSKWEERTKRIHWDSLYVIMTERDWCRKQDIKEFDKLDYCHKVVFVSKPMPEIYSSVYIPRSEEKIQTEQHKVIGLTSYTGKFTGKRYIDYFDYVGFLNEK